MLYYCEQNDQLYIICDVNTRGKNDEINMHTTVRMYSKLSFILLLKFINGFHVAIANVILSHFFVDKALESHSFERKLISFISDGRTCETVPSVH